MLDQVGHDAVVDDARQAPLELGQVVGVHEFGDRPSDQVGLGPSAEHLDCGGVRVGQYLTMMDEDGRRRLLDQVAVALFGLDLCRDVRCGATIA